MSALAALGALLPVFGLLAGTAAAMRSCDVGLLLGFGLGLVLLVGRTAAAATPMSSPLLIVPQINDGKDGRL